MSFILFTHLAGFIELFKQKVDLPMPAKFTCITKSQRLTNTFYEEKEEVQ